MRLIDYFDRGADLFPRARTACTMARVAGPMPMCACTTHRVANGLLAAGLGVARRPRSIVPIMPRPTPACWASCAPASPGRRSMRAMRWRKISTSSTTPMWSSCSIIRASRARCRAFARPAPKIRNFVCIDRAGVRAPGSRAHQAERAPDLRRRSRRGGLPCELRRHHRPAQGRADHQPQHRDHERRSSGPACRSTRRRSISWWRR